MFGVSRLPPRQGCHGGCLARPERAPKLGQIGHVTIHKVPGGFRRVLVAAIVLIWFLLYPRGLQLRSFAAASAYTIIEYNFTWVSDGKAFTSLAQFWGNLLYTPILLDVYWHYFGRSPILYILCFPFNVWLLEIILDRLFIICYTRNVAWCYCTYSDSACGGAIRLGHGIWWLLMGAGCWIIFPTLLSFTDKTTTSGETYYV